MSSEAKTSFNWKQKDKSRKTNNINLNRIKRAEANPTFHEMNLNALQNNYPS